MHLVHVFRVLHDQLVTMVYCSSFLEFLLLNKLVYYLACKSALHCEKWTKFNLFFSGLPLHHPSIHSVLSVVCLRFSSCSIARDFHNCVAIASWRTCMHCSQKCMQSKSLCCNCSWLWIWIRVRKSVQIPIATVSWPLYFGLMARLWLSFANAVHYISC